MFLFGSGSSLNEQIVQDLNVAKNEARDLYKTGLIRSRGKFVRAYSASSGIIAGEAESWPLSGWKDLKANIQKLTNEYPDLEFVTVSGGFNWASCINDFLEGNYDSYVSEWEVTVWEK